MNWKGNTDLPIRRARKHYRCQGCGGIGENGMVRRPAGCREIAAGDHYVEILWEAPAFHSGKRVCLECAREFL